MKFPTLGSCFIGSQLPLIVQLCTSPFKFESICLLGAPASSGCCVAAREQPKLHVCAKTLCIVYEVTDRGPHLRARAAKARRLKEGLMCGMLKTPARVPFRVYSIHFILNKSGQESLKMKIW